MPSIGSKTFNLQKSILGSSILGKSHKGLLYAEEILLLVFTVNCSIQRYFVKKILFSDFHYRKPVCKAGLDREDL